MLDDCWLVVVAGDGWVASDLCVCVCVCVCVCTCVRARGGYMCVCESCQNQHTDWHKFMLLPLHSPMPPCSSIIENVPSR